MQMRPLLSVELDRDSLDAQEWVGEDFPSRFARCLRINLLYLGYDS